MQIDLRNTLTSVLAAALAGLIAWLAITYSALIAEVAAVVFGAFILSLAIRPLADTLGRFKIPPALTVLLVYLVVIGVFALIARLTAPAVLTEVAQMQESGPELLSDALDQLAALPFLRQAAPSLDTIGQSLGQAAQTAAGALVSAAASIGKFVVDILLVLILTVFFTADRGIGKGMLVAWIPPAERERAFRIVRTVSQRLSRWVGAQLGVALYFAVAYGGGLTLIGVPFGLTIGIIGGILEIVPFLGGAFAIVAAILSVLTVAPGKVIWVLLLHLLVTQIEGNFVQPTLYGRAVNVHPAAILVALLIGVSAGGILGALFAVPVAVVVTVVLRELEPFRGTEGSEGTSERGRASDSTGE